MRGRSGSAHLVSTPKRFEIRFKVTLSTPHNVGSAYPMNPFSPPPGLPDRLGLPETFQNRAISRFLGEHA